jgi:superfamily II DNA/RNA helicase
VDDDPEFLSAEASNNAAMVHIEPLDGEWSSFPEVHKKTKEILIAKGYKALFPIQQHSFYPVY